MRTCQPLLSFVAGLAVLAMTGSILPPPALAQAPVCSLETMDSVACIAGRLCTCIFARGSPATGLPDGFRWDCGILRPACGEPLPATIDAYRGPLPESLAIERSNTSITTIQSSRNRAVVDEREGKPKP
ncbi:hypothetical protein [Benzoatithermus flavus]|uniref:Secreted protein n=1 Tax=Benzoatithermus flavus TaxID=3108223 RepID=A0ABU8XM40_9PROT